MPRSLPAPRGMPASFRGPPAATAPEPTALRLRAGDERLTGLVLAGGRSRRMGTDKAFIELAGRPLLAWVLDALGAVCDDRIIVTHEADPRFGRFGVPVIVDQVPARCALSGLHAGLRAASTDLCLAVACDLPLVLPRLLGLLADAVGDALAAVPDAGAVGLPAGGPAGAAGAAGALRAGGVQPLLAAYRKGCLPAIERLLARGPAPASMVAGAVPSVVVGPERWRAADPDGRSFHNVNTLSDLAAAAQLLNRPSS